uniref:DUF7024 domain-containing protein n=1 Tax=Orrella sp. TaxID=1921583 RepID=UPI0040474DA0
MIKKTKYLLDIRIILSLIAAFYFVIYFHIPSTPGNSPGAHPLGWWGWFDQGKYILSADAFSKFDFSPDKHFYPPLYSLLGAIFLHWSSGHLFILINFVSLIWFAYVFIRFSDLYTHRFVSIALLFSTSIFNYTIFENYVIPWTSTLAVALLASGILGLVWLIELKRGDRNKISRLQIFFIATCLGLLVPTRPADAVIGCVLGISLLIGYWRIHKKSINCVPRPLSFLMLFTSGSIIGPSIFLVLNTLVYGSPFGSYIQVASSNGFFPADIAEKFVSIWLDGFALYGEPNAGLAERYPWLLISLAGLLWVLIRGDGALRSVAVSIILLFILYLPYGDLLPNGLWRFLNIHYFKWTFPFLALFAVILIKQMWFAWRQRSGRFLTTNILFGIPLLLLSLHFVFDVVPVSTSTTQNPTEISFDLPNKKIDFVDFKGLSGGFTDVYLGSHRLLLDGKELVLVRDYRLLPMSWGVRLLFIRPIIGRSMEFLPDQRLIRQTGPLGSQIGNYKLSLGTLKPFRKVDQQQIVTDYFLGEIIDFSSQGSSNLYATHGWSGAEAWGRWSINGEAAIQMRLANPSNHDLKLTLVMGGFVSESQPCQEVSIIFNKKKISQYPLCLRMGGEKLSSHKFVLPRKLLHADGRIDISLVTPNSISPKKLGISSDDRVIGVGIKSLVIEASED